MADQNSGGRNISDEDESMMRTYLVEEGGIGMNTAASLSGEDLKRAYEATRKRVTEENKTPVQDKKKDGGYILLNRKNYARGGGVRKANFMDD